MGIVLSALILYVLVLVVWCNLSRPVAGRVAASFLGIRVALGLLPLLLNRAA
jgi:hypothetical protein